MLWLIKGLGPGGAERLLVEMAARLDRDRFTCEAAYLVPWKDHLAAELEAAGVPVTCLELRRSFDPRWLLRLRRILRRGRFQIVHAHLPFAAIGARVVARSLGRRRPAVISTDHNTWERYRPVTRSFNRWTFRWNDAAIAVSEEVARSMGADVRPRPEVIPNGVDAGRVRANACSRAEARAELGLPSDALVVGTVGGLTPKKGHVVLAEAARRVAARLPEVAFCFVGLKADPEPVHRAIAQAGVARWVHLAGYRPEAARLMPAFDVFCLPSLFEGMPVALLEAMALGLPSVVTSVGGVPEVVTDGQDALVGPPGDAVRLAEGIIALLVDARERARLGERARATAERFDLAAMVGRTEDVYLRALERVR